MFSLVCAIQCALAPILLSLAPIIPKWAHFGHGWVWISVILAIALWSIGRGFHRHRDRNVVALAISGITLLIVGNITEGQITLLLESLVFVSGGLLLTVAHWKNYQLEKTIS